jgi:hypothetical protein
VFWSSALLRKGHAFRGQALYKGPTFLFIIWGLWVSKDAEFNEDFKNINLVTKCPLSSVEIRFSGITFLGAFCHEA